MRSFAVFFLRGAGLAELCPQVVALVVFGVGIFNAQCAPVPKEAGVGFTTPFFFGAKLFD